MPRMMPAVGGDEIIPGSAVYPSTVVANDGATMKGGGERTIGNVLSHQPIAALESSASMCASLCGSPQVPETCAPHCGSSAGAFVNPGSEPGHCHPQCTWKCESPVCDEVCEPECEAPSCETRCQGIDTSGCRMECDEPQCAVVCPERTCETGGCPACTTTCSEPLCKLKCPDTQPCQNICEQPNCRWKCKAPEKCPAPRCSMECESPPACMGSTYRELPPLAEGESSVRAFAAPLAPLGAANATHGPTVQAEQSLVHQGDTHTSRRTVELPMHTNKVS